jgi:hypothetical protein
LWTPCGSVGSDWPLRIEANRQCLRQCGGSTWRWIGQSDVSIAPRASDHRNTADLQCFGSGGSGAPLTTTSTATATTNAPQTCSPHGGDPSRHASRGGSAMHPRVRAARAHLVLFEERAVCQASTRRRPLTVTANQTGAGKRTAHNVPASTTTMSRGQRQRRRRDPCAEPAVEDTEMMSVLNLNDVFEYFKIARPRAGAARSAASAR